MSQTPTYIPEAVEKLIHVSTIDGFTQAGMTLRDWFAGQALAAMPKLGDTDAGVAGIAHDAFLLADAMLATRSAGIKAGRAGGGS